MRICAVDYETSGLDPAIDRVVEIGACLWDTSLKGMIRMMDLLLWADDYPSMSEETVKAHGLSNELLKNHAVAPSFAWKFFNDYFVNGADAFLAHNGLAFDKGFYLAECERDPLILSQDLPWIDSMELPYPAEWTTRKLTYLAAESGFLNPFPHRAVFDVMTMLMVFSQYDAERALWYCQQPQVTLQALVSYDDRQKAKDRGYRWEAERKRWIKLMRLPDVEKEKAMAGFQVREVL